jgi:hypothetical protein
MFYWKWCYINMNLYYSKTNLEDKIDPKMILGTKNYK